MRKANIQVIKAACAELKAMKDEAIRAAMYGLLEDAVQIALDAHDEKHQSHIELGDTYGWMLLHDGKVEDIVVVATNDNRGRATKQLRTKALTMMFKKGWVGVIMAGLEPASYFSVVYETGMLDFSMQMTKQNFFQYFDEI